MKIAEMLGKSLSLDVKNLSLSEEDLKDLLHDKNKDFVVEYLLSSGARKIESVDKNDLEDDLNNNELLTQESEKMTKLCYLGYKGAQTRKEAIDLIKDIIVDDPLKKGFKTGYKTAAAVLNKNGYRNHKGKKWTARSVCGFLRSKDLSTPVRSIKSSTMKTQISPPSPKSASYSINEIADLVMQVMNSNLDQKVKVFLASKLCKLND